CRACDTVVATPAPDHVIARGRAGAGLLAHIVVSKYDDHLPLYRQAEIFARDGISLETSTLSGWVGATAAALKPLVDTLAAAVLAGDNLHVDDTPVPVLAPGTGKTKTGRLWTYVRDERPFAGARPPAALFFYSPDRKGEHPQAHLRHFRGVIHADGYAGFNELFVGGRIVEAGCWAHVRRKFFDVHAATGSPIAKEALDRIGQLYAVEKTINGSPPERRQQQRQLQSKPIAEALAAWADNTVRQLSRKSELAAAFRYMRARWTALVRCFDDGRLALDNNPVERALRCVAIGRKNYLFAGSDAGGRRAAAIYSLIESAKLNGLNPQHYLTDVLTRIADHPARHIAELLPWNWQPFNATRAGPLTERLPRQAPMRRSSVRRTPTPISGWRRRISSKMATGRRPGALFNKGTISPSQTSASGSRRRRPRGAFLLRRQPWILFDTIGGGGAEPGFGRGDCRRLGLAETHIQPHLAVGDVAGGAAA